MIAWIALALILASGALLACSGSIPGLRALFGAPEPARDHSEDELRSFFDDYQH